MFGLPEGNDRDNVMALVPELVPASLLGKAFVGSLPSVVYHKSAPCVMSLIVNCAALSPIMFGLPTMNWNCAETMALFERPDCSPIALMVRLGKVEATVRLFTCDRNRPSWYPTGAEADEAVGSGTLAAFSVFE